MPFRTTGRPTRSTPSGPTTIPAAVEEVLRLRSPFTTAGRVTAAPVAIPGDRSVLVRIPSANHGEQAFPDPGAFVLDRGIGGGRQIASGHGVHVRLGAPLARSEARVAREELTARYDALSPTSGSIEDLQPSPRGVLGVRRLPVKGVRSYSG